MDVQEQIDDFLRGDTFAVVGATPVRSKFGNKVLRAYLENGKRAIPINPRGEEIEGQKVYRDLMSLPEPVHGVSIITPPAITEQIVEDAAAAGITRVWMQPGAESDEAIERARALGMTVIAGGPCLLVEIR